MQKLWSMVSDRITAPEELLTIRQFFHLLQINAALIIYLHFQKTSSPTEYKNFSYT